MLPTRITILAAVAVAATLTLAACGGDDDSGSDDDAEITEAIEQAGTSGDPAACTEFQTQAFTEQTEYETGDAAITSCEEDDNTAGETVEVENIEVDGDTATAEATFADGGLDGQTLGISLAKEGDQWKLDSLDEFVVFDQNSFVGALVDDLNADPDVPPDVTTCVGSSLSSASGEQIQSAFLSGDENELVGLFGNCFAGA